MHRLILTTALAFLAGAAALTLATLGVAVSHAGSHERTCFPAKQWGPKADGLRPCVTVTRVYEDGSFSYRVSDGNGTVRYHGSIGAKDR